MNQAAPVARGIERRLTIVDAIELGVRLKTFRESMGGLPPKQLRKFGFLRLWHAESHRKQWGADYRWRYEQILQEGREALRLARAGGSGLAWEVAP